MKFELTDLLAIAKRDNNTLRPYLFVNPFQGKHIPAEPKVSLQLFQLLAQKVEQRYQGERLLVIGFAETATAIGAAVAWYAENVAYYMTTTREDIAGAEYLHFTESHSHATDQRLIANGLEDCLETIDRIVFAEDEVTTGSTIEKCINELRRRFPASAKRFGIASLLNSMSDQRLSYFSEQDIPCDYLYHIDRETMSWGFDENQWVEPHKSVKGAVEIVPTRMTYGNGWDERFVTPKAQFKDKIDTLMKVAIPDLALTAALRKILILGTEEFMFPAMFLGMRIEELHPDTTVRFHATSRSPIMVSEDVNYPLHSRYELESLYEKGRKTNVYNLSKYDLVIIVTDAYEINEEGLQTLLHAIFEDGNKNCILIRWRNDVP